MVELEEQQKKDLEELKLSPGWPVYKALLKEMLDNYKRLTLKAPDWDHFAASRACLEMLEYKVLPLVEDALSEEEESHE